MADYKDVGHRPHARHTGEFPEFSTPRGPAGLRVSLDAWGPKEDLFAVLYDQFQSNWGEAPSNLKDVIKTRRTEGKLNAKYASVITRLDTQSGWSYLTDEEQAFVTKAFAGQTLSNPLEAISFMFTIDGVSRACTHQLVRTRIGASFMQHGGRDNDWRHRDWTLPETLHRALEEYDKIPLEAGQRSCVTNPSALNELAGEPVWSDMMDLDDRPFRSLVEKYLHMGHELYAALVDIGIPWQDARRVLHMGTQTYLHANYTYPALAGVLANRLEHIMDWEINCVSQLMLRELHMKCPVVMWQFLGSHSDKAKVAKFAGLDSWPPDGKWPVQADGGKCVCGHQRALHHPLPSEHIFNEYRPCNQCPCLDFRPAVLDDRAHRPEQMPFWVLSPTAMAGGPIEWIATNGTYPEDLKP